MHSFFRVRALMHLLLVLLALAALCYSRVEVDDDSGQQITGTNVWIGNEFAANNSAWLKEASITHIISAIGEPRQGRIEGLTYVTLDLRDDGNSVLPYIYEVHEYLTKSADPVTSRVLIYCGAGASESATLVAGHLMLSDWGLDADDAIERVKSVRPIVNPSAGFLSDLYELDTNIYVMALNETTRFGDYISQLKEEL